jgi:hypothetical protein
MTTIASEDRANDRGVAGDGVVVHERLGLGWNLSYVAATAELAERTEPWERGRLLGFNDLLSGATGARLTLLGGLVLTTVGVADLAIDATALVVVPGLWILRQAQRRTGVRSQATSFTRRTSPRSSTSPPWVTGHEAW